MKNKTKKIFASFIIIILLIALIYVSNITQIPDKIILFEGENLKLKTVLGLQIDSKTNKNNNYEVVETNANTVSNKTGRVDLTVSLFGKIPVKEIDISVIKNTEVIPLGNLIGLKLYTNRSISSRNERNSRRG